MGINPIAYLRIQEPVLLSDAHLIQSFIHELNDMEEVNADVSIWETMLRHFNEPSLYVASVVLYGIAFFGRELHEVIDEIIGVDSGKDIDDGTAETIGDGAQVLLFGPEHPARFSQLCVGRRR